MPLFIQAGSKDKLNIGELMVSHPGHILGSLLAIALFVWLLSVVGVRDMIQVIMVSAVLLVGFFAVYYMKTEGDIMRRRRDKSEKAKLEEKVKLGEREILENERRTKLKKDADIALEQVKASRCDELCGLDAEQKAYLIEGWRTHIIAYLEKGWTFERAVEKVSKGIPPS